MVSRQVFFAFPPYFSKLRDVLAGYQANDQRIKNSIGIKDVLGMQAGDRCVLLLPPAMAYGKRAIEDVIPANASMQFFIDWIRPVD